MHRVFDSLGHLTALRSPVRIRNPKSGIWNLKSGIRVPVGYLSQTCKLRTWTLNKKIKLKGRVPWQILHRTWENQFKFGLKNMFSTVVLKGDVLWDTRGQVYAVLAVHIRIRGPRVGGSRVSSNDFRIWKRTDLTMHLPDSTYRKVTMCTHSTLLRTYATRVRISST